MEQILLFYKYVYIQYPKQLQKWQQRLCASLGLTGRIIIAHEGINATLGGSVAATEAYQAAMRAQEIFADIDFKSSPGSAADFPRCAVLVKDEIVRLGIDPQQYTAAEGGEHISPQDAHELMQKAPEDLIILDARNNYESRVGTFQGSITPDIATFREFPAYIDNNTEQFKDKTVLMHCTGGIRCERASAYLKSKNVAKKVLQISGGIHRYTEQFPDGFFRGKNYVFDGRIAVKINDDILTTCAQCNQACDRYINCINTRCNDRVILCAPCAGIMNSTCSEACRDLIAHNMVPQRVIPARTCRMASE